MPQPTTYRGHRRSSFIELDPDHLIELRARQRTFGGAYERAALGNLGYALLVLKIFNPDFAKIGLLYVILSILILLIAQYRRRRSDHDFADVYQKKTQPRPVDVDELRLGGQGEQRPLDPTLGTTNPIGDEPRRQLGGGGGGGRGGGRDDEGEDETGETRRAEDDDDDDEPIDHVPPRVPPLPHPLPLPPTVQPSEGLTQQHQRGVGGDTKVWGREFRTSGDMVVLIGVTCSALYSAMLTLVLKLPA
ncbi:hypothetical protein JCM10212_006694 [Sporobolomyces blumeae]